MAAKGFVAQAVEVKSDDPQGTVLSSDPEQGHRAEEGSTVTLSVAVPRIVPAIVGATSEEAAQALEAEGFTAVTYTEEKSNEAAGTVLAVSPEAGTEAKSGDAITVTVAVPYTVPDVEGMSEADARKIIWCPVAEEEKDLAIILNLKKRIEMGTPLTRSFLPSLETEPMTFWDLFSLEVLTTQFRLWCNDARVISSSEGRLPLVEFMGIPSALVKATESIPYGRTSFQP